MKDAMDLTPLQRLDGLDAVKRTAFLSLFRVNLDDLQGIRHASEGFDRPLKFDKWECERVPGSEAFYRHELPALGFVRYSEGERLPALGLRPGSLYWKVEISITPEGFEARDAWYARLRESAARLMTADECEDMERATEELDARLGEALANRPPRGV